MGVGVAPVGQVVFLSLLTVYVLTVRLVTEEYGEHPDEWLLGDWQIPGITYLVYAILNAPGLGSRKRRDLILFDTSNPMSFCSTHATQCQISQCTKRY